MTRRRVLGLIAALLVGGAFLAWVPDRPLEELRAKWAPPPYTFLAVDGINVHVRDEGPRDDAEPIEAFLG